jgi:hypothetical protein
MMPEKVMEEMENDQFVDVSGAMRVREAVELYHGN